MHQVHQIQSGQVIVDLCSVVKELVENSLDASATTIGRSLTYSLSLANCEDVRFKNQGLEAIEVQDNGHGIPPQNYDTLALKHHTSKLSKYADLTTLQTFGFRGEALSSLCAVSRFSVVTCIGTDAPRGTKLEFATSGKVQNKSMIATQRGTTVTVENLFNNLPVRRQELERNIKREWMRVVTVLSQYACIQTGIKFTLSQQVAKGKRTTIFSTKGNLTTRENIVNVFGAKTLVALIPLDLKLEMEATNVPGQAITSGGCAEVTIQGHISRPAFGEGRQLPDKQMFFVNSRPCGLPQVTKAFNEVYKAYNTTQSPFIFANIILDTHLYDVNVSPDKRTILLHDQSRMLESLKSSLTSLFESQDYTVPVSQLPLQRTSSYKQTTLSREMSRQSRHTSSDSSGSDTDDGGVADATLGTPLSTKSNGSLSRTLAVHQQSDARNNISPSTASQLRERVQTHSMKVDLSSTSKLTTSDMNQATDTTSNEDDKVATAPASQCSGMAIPVISPSPLTSPMASMSSRTRDFVDASSITATITVGEHTVTSPFGSSSFKNHDSIGKGNGTKKVSIKSSAAFGSRLSQMYGASTGHGQTTLALDESNDEASNSIDDQGNESFEDASQDSDSQEPHELEEDNSTSQELDSIELCCAETQHANDNDQGAAAPMEVSTLELLADGVESDSMNDEEKGKEEARVQGLIADAEQAAIAHAAESFNRSKALLKGSVKRKDATVALAGRIVTSLASIAEHMRALALRLTIEETSASTADPGEPGFDTPNAEEALSLTIKKDDFANMKIIGQFNLGFILALRSSSPTNSDPSKMVPGDDIFIIDQHASDEKYNFERLQATTIVQSQRLVHPLTLDLTAVEEEIVINHQSSLEHNGFIVHVDQTGATTVGQRCQLISLPLSREVVFSVRDLEELIGLLAEHSGGGPLVNANATTVANVIPRPAKVRKMHAMRACRGSIMIGKTLTLPQMQRVVRNLGGLDKPWNCPHGRPTMRHLASLANWDKSAWDEDTRDKKIPWAEYLRAVKRQETGVQQ